MTFSGIQKSSLVDYPGRVACVLFVPGCNYNCFYCHNRQLIDGPFDTLDQQELDTFLRKRAGLLDAVVITGGEPTLQPGLESYIKNLRDMGYLVKLDTNGSDPERVKALLDAGLCDYYAVDYKVPAARYAQVCGKNASAEPVLRTVGLLLDSGACFEVRTTVFPQLSFMDLEQMASELPQLPCYVLNRYNVPLEYLPEDEVRIRQTPYTPQEVVALADRLKARQPGTVAG